MRGRGRRSTARRGRKAQARRDWDEVIERLNASPRGELRVRMGSPGSAQVTRVRLLEQWRNLEAHTVGSTLHLRLRGG